MFDNDLLISQKPGPIDGFFFISSYEIKTGKSSLKNAGNTSLFKIDSCQALEIKILSRRLCMKPIIKSLLEVISKYPLANPRLKKICMLPLIDSKPTKTTF